jgi:hypothetical protein
MILDSIDYVSVANNHLTNNCALQLSGQAAEQVPLRLANIVSVPHLSPTVSESSTGIITIEL